MKKKPKGAKGMADLPPLPKLPPHRVGSHNNIVWDISLPFELTRMDHSLHMGQAWGTIKDSNGKQGSVSVALGGFVFVLDVEGKGSFGSRRYAIDLASVIETVFRLDKELGKVPRLETPKAPSRKGGQ